MEQSSNNLNTELLKELILVIRDINRVLKRNYSMSLKLMEVMTVIKRSERNINVVTCKWLSRNVFSPRKVHQLKSPFIELNLKSIPKGKICLN